MRKLLTRQLPLLALGLLPWASTLHAQTLDPQEALEKALATRAQWASPGYPAADMRVSSAYADPGGLEHVYVQQLHLGIPVFNQLQSLAFSKGKLALHTGRFVSSKPLAALAATPTLPADAAVSRALQHLHAPETAAPPRIAQERGPEQKQTFAGAGVAKHDITASLVWAFDEQQPHLAWNVNVDMLETPDWWNVRVDAITGAIVSQDNWTAHENLPAPAADADAPAASAPLVLAPPANTGSSYLVIPYPVERPVSASSLQTETNPWLKAGATNLAVTYGWHFDGTTSYASTRGNNVAAYDDGGTTNAPGNYAPSLTPAPTYSFNYLPSFSTAPMLDNNRNAAVTNLFYWNNIIHDVFYQYGFTEPAGNFQADNLGRGGAGNDYVRAEAQDGAGLNNANFSTPNDGTSGRMQMYLWNYNTPTYRLTVTAPAAVAGTVVAVEGRISANNSLSTLGPLSGTLALYTDANGSSSTGCTTYGGTAGALTGKIAVVYRSTTCRYITQVKNAQLAGAIAVVMINNVTTAPVAMSGTDNSITIPAVMISQADGARLVAQLTNGVTITLPLAPYIQEIDGDYDSGVMVHEYGHGLSTRLTGGPANSSCLGNAEQGGEGWSDYVALMLTTNWATAQLSDGANRRPVGTYVVAQAPTAGGIRRYPYSTSLTINPLTYANVATNPEVHAIGEVWCAALWDMTWGIIQQRGTIEANLYNGSSTGGNAIAFQLVTQGMKLQPCQPGFLDARDAILAADSLLYQGQYHCAIWTAFARRGMGYSAKEGLSTSATDQTAAFDLPPGVNLIRQDGLRIGTSFTVAFALYSDCQQGGNYTLTDELPTGLQFVSSSTGGTLVGNKVTFSNLGFTAPGQTRTVSFVAQATPSASCPIALPVNDNRDNNQTGGFANQTLSGNAAWTTSSTYAVSGNAWFATPPTVPTDFALASAPFTPTGLSTLAFYHYYDFESSFDGGTVEVSTDNGTTWQNVGAALFAQNGYTSVFDASTTGAGEPAFSGRSVKGNPRFIQSLVDLRSFAGQSIRIRFRVRTDSGSPNTYDGWYIDEIRVLNGCGGYQKVELRDASGNVQTSQNLVTYLVNTLATQPTLAAATQLQAHPNPFGTSGLQLSLTLPAAQSGLRFTIYDVAGRILRQQTVAQAPAGASTVSLPEAATLPAGLYLLRLQLPDGSSQTLRVEHE
ncbi:MAG: M36 family metallopeptidase [Janthinobacterium lividum]